MGATNNDHESFYFDAIKEFASLDTPSSEANSAGITSNKLDVSTIDRPASATVIPPYNDGTDSDCDTRNVYRYYYDKPVAEYPTHEPQPIAAEEITHSPEGISRVTRNGNTFRPGDSVFISDPGEYYPTHRKAAAKLGAINWQERYGECPLLPGATVRIVSMIAETHAYGGPEILALVAAGHEEFILNINGLVPITSSPEGTKHSGEDEKIKSDNIHTWW